jgi:hypothetical protein
MFDDRNKQAIAYEIAAKHEAENDYVLPRAVTPQALRIESQGWEKWLLTLFPFAFEEQFSDDHRKFWDLYWSVILRIREQRKYLATGLPIPPKFHIEPKEFVILLILGRGLAKSSTIEASSVMRGAMLGGGYCLYICEAQDQANEHIGNCKTLITHEDSRIAEFYPGMELDEKAVIGGKKTKDREDLFITASGWICRAKGLNSRLRGLRIGNRRPDDINIDDIDGVNDSIAVSVKKLKQLTSSVIPTQARRHTTIKFGQNLIAENGVMTQIHVGKSDALSERTTIGVSNTFVYFRQDIEYQTYLDENDGRVKHKILDTAIATWAGVDIAQAQKFLNDSGLETFIAEYQNSFAHLRTEKVFHEFDEKRHIISWSQFEMLFGSRYVPPHWKAKATADIGYSRKSISAWMFVAASAKNSPLPSHYFCYRAKSFIQDSIDDQAISIWEDMFPDEQIGKRHFEATQSFADYPELFRLLNTKPKCQSLLKDYVYNPKTNTFENKPTINFAPDASDDDKAMFYVEQAKKTFKSQISIWTISHEKTGEQKTLAQKYGIPCGKTREFKADSGVSETNHLLRGDYTKPHPFYPDEEVLDQNGKETGLYKLGCPFMFFIVDDLQVKAPKDDDGMKTLREQVSMQQWTEEKLTERGLTTTIPMKFNSDYCDALRMFAVDYAMPEATELTKPEQIQKRIAEINKDAIIKEEEFISVERQMQILATQQVAAEKLQEEDFYDEDEEMY